MRKKPSALAEAVSAKVSSLTDAIGARCDKISGWFDGQTALTALFAGSIVIANVLASKVAAFDIPFYGLAAAPAGFVALGAAFLFTDTLGELYGPEAAHKAVNGTILAVVASLGLIHLSVLMPSAPFYPLGEQYATVLTASTSISLASVATMAVSQNIDVSLFHRAKRAGLPKWVRNIGSTVVSQFVDTVLFIGLAFAVLPHVVGGTLTPLSALPSLIVSQYLLKVLVATLDTPLFYVLTSTSE
jgi:uncharacterized integral membrane protein (TIGR00697 family)